jgi:hypothetical protein
MSNITYLPQRLKLDGGGELVLDMTARKRSDMAWERAKAYAKHKAEAMYPDLERRKKEEHRLAHQHYCQLMFP